LEEMERFDPIPSFLPLKDYRFLNAGAYVGHIRDLLWLIEGVLSLSDSFDFKSDQRLFFEFYWLNKDRIVLDTQQAIFGNFITVQQGPCPNGWQPPCTQKPCCIRTDEIDLMPQIYSQYSVIEKCTVTRKEMTKNQAYGKQGPHHEALAFDDSEVEATNPILWHGNGMGKMMYLAVLNKLAVSCPFVAEAILKVEEYSLRQSVYYAANLNEAFQERTASYREAEAQRDSQQAAQLEDHLG